MAERRQLKLFDSLTRKPELLKVQGGSFGFYACGPTVYGRAHIGNFRTFVCMDLLVRTLKAFGYPLQFVRNITDVDDKTIRGAQQAGVRLAEFTRQHIDSFESDCRALALTPPDIEPRATAHIPEMIGLVEKLLAAKHAYVADDGSVYFRIESFKNYGCLCHLDREGLRPGARVAQDEYEKEGIADFVLWKKHRPEDGDVKWDSPWGPGRPGWHLECSAMSMKYLGESYDLHGGGIDLLFPHHENEIAQSEGATGKPFVKHWWHVAHLLVDGRKMSKSLGNLYTLDDIRSWGYEGNEFGDLVELRYALMSAHYREQFNFTREGLEAAYEAVNRIGQFLLRLDYAVMGDQSLVSSRPGKKPSDWKELQEFREVFLGHLSEDLNISAALGELFTMIRLVNIAMDRKAMTQSEAEEWSTLIRGELLERVLGLRFALQHKPPANIQQLAIERTLAREQKKWEEADRLRSELKKQGWEIKDTASGFKLTRLK